MYKKCCNGIIHTIKKGDTLYSLSRLYNVPLVMILRANPYVDVYNLKIGAKVCVPSCWYDGEGNTTETQKAIVEVPNEEPEMMTSQDVEIQPEKKFAYVVKEGDSVKDIMDKFGVELDEILENNRLSDLLLKQGIAIILPLDD